MCSFTSVGLPVLFSSFLYLTMQFMAGGYEEFCTAFSNCLSDWIPQLLYCTSRGSSCWRDEHTNDTVCTLSKGRNRLPPLVSSTGKIASKNYQATTYSWLVSSFQTAVVWNHHFRSEQRKPFCYKFQFPLDGILLLCHLLHPLWDQLTLPPVASFVEFYGEHTRTYIVAWKCGWSSRQFLTFLSIFALCMSDFLLFF